MIRNTSWKYQEAGRWIELLDFVRDNSLNYGKCDWKRERAVWCGTFRGHNNEWCCQANILVPPKAAKQSFPL